MTAKEYLSQYSSLDREIHILQEQVKDLEEKAESISHMSGSSNSSAFDKIGKTVARLVDTKNEIISMIDNLLALKKEIEGVIAELENPKYSQILTLRYINGKKWENIAQIMHMDLRWVHRLHGRALQKIQIPDHI